MKVYPFLLAVLFLFGKNLIAQDTFSIVAADPETGEIGAAGASCVQNIAALGGIQLLNKIIPGKGGVNAQAYVCINPHINLDNAIEQMDEGLNPDEIIDWLQNNDECFSQGFDPEYRQYGIVDFDADGTPRTAAFTGSQADDWKGHILGPNYAIQGNILLGEEILQNMEDGFVNTEGSLAEKLMAAMQGANVPGADSRCLDAGTSSTSAFLRVVRPDDVIGEHYLELNVLETPTGEEPIDSLQTLFDAWSETINSTQDVDNEEVAVVFPNPAKNTVTLKWLVAKQENLTASLVDTSGKVWSEQVIRQGQNQISLPSGIQEGLLFIYVKNGVGELLFSDKILLDRK